MKVEQLKSKLIKDSIFSVVVIVLVIVINSYVTKKVNGFKNKLNSINSQISQIQAKLSQEQKEYDEFVKRYQNEFLNIPKSKLPDNNKKLDDDLVKIQLVTKYVNNIVDKLDIFKPKLKILPTNRNQPIIEEKGYNLSKSVLEINFKTKTDSFVYAFLKHLQSDEFEGYIKLKSLEISLLGEPNKVFINTLARTGNLLPLIEAKISLDWYNYLDKNNKLTIQK